MYCPNCGTSVADNTKFCPACGSPVQAQAQNNAAPNQGAAGGQQNPYGAGQQQNPYGAGQQQNPYGGQQNPYGAGQQQNPYGGQPPYTQPPFGSPVFAPAPIHRRNIAVAIILSIITCGIYMFYWIYCISRDLIIASRNPNDTPPGTVILLSFLTCGIYLYYWFYKSAGSLCAARMYARGNAGENSAVLYLILAIFGFSIVSMALIQNELNSIAAYGEA